jgi:cell division protein FtsQ
MSAGYLRWSLRGVLLAAAIIGAAAGWDRLRHAEQFRLRSLLVQGEFARVAPNDVYRAVHAQLGASFLTVDLGAARAAVEALPWVATASVRREWPGTLRIALTEEVPVATWRGRGLINAAGVVFAEGGAAFAALPALAGPEGSAAEVLATYAEMQRAVAASGLVLTRVEQSERRAWIVWFDDGTQVRLGRRDALPRLGRYASVAAPVVAPQAAHIAYVDMRYANGFALGWRTPQPVVTGTKKRRTPSEKTDV